MKYVWSLIAALLFAFAFGVAAAAPASAEYVPPSPPTVEPDAPKNDVPADGCAPPPGKVDECVSNSGGGAISNPPDEPWVPEPVNDYSKDPYQQGNAPTGGGPNVDSGPGEYVAPPSYDTVSRTYHDYIVEEKDGQLSTLRVTTIVSLLAALVSAGFALWSVYDLRRVRSKITSGSVDSVKPTLAKQYRPASKVSPANYKK